MFADDTNLYFENKSAEILNYNCQTELKNINKWLIYDITYRLSLHLNKNCYMLINSRTIINMWLNLYVFNHRICFKCSIYVCIYSVV